MPIQERCSELTASNEVTPWSRLLPEKLTGPQVVKKFPHFMEPERSLRHSHSSATCPYSEPKQSSQWPHFTSWTYILILPSHLHLGLPSVLFPSDLSIKTLYAPLLSPYAPQAPPISLFLISSLVWYWMRITKHLAPRHERTGTWGGVVVKVLGY